MLAGKKFAGTAKSGGDLIRNQQHAIAITGFPYLLQIARMVETHAARTLHNRLQNDGCQLPVMLFYQPGEIIEIRLVPFIIKAAGRGRRKVMLGQIAAPQAVHRVFGSHTDIAAKVSP